MSQYSSEQMTCLKALDITLYQARDLSPSHRDIITPFMFQPPCLVIYESTCLQDDKLSAMLHGMLSVLDIEEQYLSKWSVSMPIMPTSINRLSMIQPQTLLLLGEELAQAFMPVLSDHSIPIFKTFSPIELTKNPSQKRAAFDCLKALKTEVSYLRN